MLVVYLHLPDDVFRRATTWIGSGGALVVVGHALRNLRDGVGGPKDPRLLYTEELLRVAAGELHIERLGEVHRSTAEGTAIDLLLVARRLTDDTSPFRATTRGSTSAAMTWQVHDERTLHETDWVRLALVRRRVA